jgi:hypothetical protein
MGEAEYTTVSLQVEPENDHFRRQKRLLFHLLQYCPVPDYSAPAAASHPVLTLALDFNSCYSCSDDEGSPLEFVPNTMYFYAPVVKSIMVYFVCACIYASKVLLRTGTGNSIFSASRR